MRRIFVLLFLFFLAGSILFAEQIQITKIEAKRDRGFDYLDIYTTGNVKARGLLLEDKLIIDFPRTKIAKDIEILKGKSKRIKEILSKQEKDKARIIIELKKDIDYEIVNVFGRNKSVVELSDRLDYAERLMAAWEAAILKKKGEVLKPYQYKPDQKSKDQVLRGKIIVLDPGHGGRDPGAITRSGILEKRLTLQLARKIARKLSSAGATVYLTRNTDRTCSLRDIVNFANKKRADVFISIHFNYCGVQKISGTETYYYNLKSRGLARLVHQSLLSSLSRKDRGLRKVMFYTIHHTRMPAILLEPLYISNYNEEKLAASPAYQNKIANAVAWGVKTYFRSKLR